MQKLARRKSACLLPLLLIIHFSSQSILRVTEHINQREPQYTNEEWRVWYENQYFREPLDKKGDKYIVSYGFNSGTADRLSGMITIFFYALLTNRTFFIYEENIAPKLEYAYDFPNVDIVLRDLESGVVSAMNSLIEQRNMSSLIYETGDKRYFLVNQVNYRNGSSHENFYVFRDILRESTDASPVIVASNRGLTFRMFENPFIQKRLQNLNLAPATAFKSFFDFLLKPNLETWSLIKPYNDILANDDILKIGIAIRVGDSVFQGEENWVMKANAFDHFFNCAQVCWGRHDKSKKHLSSLCPLHNILQEIETSRAINGQKVIWYLISDSLVIRKLIKDRFGDKVITDLKVKPNHPDCVRHWKQNCSDDDIKFSIRWAVAQLEIFRRMDFHVVTNGSGFGMVGAILSNNQKIYAMKNTGSSRPCGLFDYDPISTLTTMWQGKSYRFNIVR